MSGLKINAKQLPPAAFRRKRAGAFLAGLMLFLVFFVFSATASATSAQTMLPYENYNYSEQNGRILTAPQAYVPQYVSYGADTGTPFVSLTDIHAVEDGTVYLLDGGSGRIAVMNSELALVNVISGFENAGTADDFIGAMGIYADDRYIYVADTLHFRVVILNSDGALEKVVNAPKSEMLGEFFEFKPMRIAVDPDRLLYIVGEGTFEGIITMDWNSEFCGFVGSNRVKPSAWDIFWMKYSSLEQRQGRVQFVPQDFSSLDVDHDGFFFCTTATKQNDSMVKRLNPGGSDVIRSLSRTPLVGDPKSVSQGSLKGVSSFRDVACGRNGVYACLDYTRGKVFVYNRDGYMLFTFGILAPQTGGFNAPSALTWLSDDRIAVADKERGCFTVFSPTAYAKTIHEGLTAQSELRWDDEFAAWQKTLSINSHFELAHLQIGKVYLDAGNYVQAMEKFRLGGSKELYARAFGKYRADWIYRNIRWILAVFLALILPVAFLVFFRKFKHRRKSRDGG